MSDIENYEIDVSDHGDVPREKNVGQLSEVLMQIGLTCSAHVIGGSVSADHADLYGEDGLPKQASN